MAFVTVTMPDGRSWTPKFVGEINQEKCIGCGRCFRVSGREVLQLVGASSSPACVSKAAIHNFAGSIELDRRGLRPRDDGGARSAPLAASAAWRDAAVPSRQIPDHRM